MGIVTSVGWSVVLLACMAYFAIGDTDTKFLHWGPSNVQFGGITVNTWGRWVAVMLYSIGSQIAYSVVSATISPYVSNVIRDHKTPLEQKGPYMRAQAIVLVYTSFTWISGVFDVFLWVTMQIQYIIPAFLVDITLTAWLTHPFLSVTRESAAAAAALPLVLEVDRSSSS